MAASFQKPDLRSLVPLSAILYVLLAALLAPPTAAPAARAQHHLLELALTQPDQRVRAIVQLEDGATIEPQVVEAGGHVTRRLPMIDALVVEMSAAESVALSRSPGVRWVSLDAPVQSAKKGSGGDPTTNYFLETTGAATAHGLGLDGTGITVAVVDSGIKNMADFNEESSNNSRVLSRVQFDPGMQGQDATGHGTHVAGIIGMNGSASAGFYQGIAPNVNLIALNVANGAGMAHESDTVAALQWILDYRDEYNIRVVNLSLNSTVEDSYHNSALNAAAEILWFNEIVVVVSAGNLQQDSTFNPVRAAPANDPFLITVGASDEKNDDRRNNDDISEFTAMGTTVDGHFKPDIIAPGEEIVSVLASNSTWKRDHADRVEGEGSYFRASGTSMAAPMVAGAVALLLQQEPGLTPDQVKHRLLSSAGQVDGEIDQESGGHIDVHLPYLDIAAAVTSSSSESANTGQEASQLLWSGDDPVNWGSINWGSINWGSINWGSVNWGSINWGSVNWGSVSW